MHNRSILRLEVKNNVFRQPIIRRIPANTISTKSSKTAGKAIKITMWLADHAANGSSTYRPISWARAIKAAISKIRYANTNIVVTAVGYLMRSPAAVIDRHSSITTIWFSCMHVKHTERLLLRASFRFLTAHPALQYSQKLTGPTNLVSHFGYSAYVSNKP